jgi:hypothetical protein
MRIGELEHVVAAAADVTKQDEFVVIGSQAILGTLDQPPEAMLMSLEADIYPLAVPEDADFIDGALGDGSPFHEAHGYYAHGVGPQTAKAPLGWRQRLVKREIPPRPGASRDAPIIAWCLEAHDLVLSKCVAGRDRDWDYASEALRAGIGARGAACPYPRSARPSGDPRPRPQDAVGTFLTQTARRKAAPGSQEGTAASDSHR